MSSSLCIIRQASKLTKENMLSKGWMGVQILVGCLSIQASVQALASTIKPETQRHLFSSGAARLDPLSSLSLQQRMVLNIRGGATEEKKTVSESSSSSQSSSKRSLTGSALLAPIGKSYNKALTNHPILTKSLTACAIFGLSDYLAQKLEQKSGGDGDKMNWTRTLTSMAVGLFYFGPAAHAWYDMIFKVFPGTGLLSTLQKAAMGQMFFGPSFTCIFFAASLWQGGQFTLGNWLQKIRRDLPGAWLAGAGFWVSVDLVSYSFIPVKYIPLFVNMCSLVWTIYLSLVANRASPRTE